MIFKIKDGKRMREYFNNPHHRYRGASPKGKPRGCIVSSLRVEGAAIRKSDYCNTGLLHCVRNDDNAIN